MKFVKKYPQALKNIQSAAEAQKWGSSFCSYSIRLPEATLQHYFFLLFPNCKILNQQLEEASTSSQEILQDTLSVPLWNSRPFFSRKSIRTFKCRRECVREGWVKSQWKPILPPLASVAFTADRRDDLLKTPLTPDPQSQKFRQIN